MIKKGFTLVELMVALAILAIVAAVAMPLYTQYSVRTYRTDAQADLLRCAQGMERHASLNFTYLSAIDSDNDGVGDVDAGAMTPNICTPNSTLYVVNLVNGSATDTTFVLRTSPANANNVIDDDGDLAFDATGAQFWDKNDDGDFGDTDEDNWGY